MKERFLSSKAELSQNFHLFHAARVVVSDRTAWPTVALPICDAQPTSNSTTRRPLREKSCCRTACNARIFEFERR